MTFDHEPYLARLDESWRAMLDAGDLYSARARILKAAVFAACTAHTAVEQAEYEYTTWIETGSFPVDGTNLAEQKASAALTAETLADSLTLDVLRQLDGWALADLLHRNVYGLGTTKAAFAAALVGYPEPYCLDTHGLQLIADRLAILGEPVKLDTLRGRIKSDRNNPAAVARAWGWYRRLGDIAFGTRDHQWEFFAYKVPAFREGAHRAYFDTVL